MTIDSGPVLMCASCRHPIEELPEVLDLRGMAHALVLDMIPPREDR
jgi:hypothetical protein